MCVCVSSVHSTEATFWLAVWFEMATHVLNLLTVTLPKIKFSSLESSSVVIYCRCMFSIGNALFLIILCSFYSKQLFILLLYFLY